MSDELPIVSHCDHCKGEHALDKLAAEAIAVQDACNLSGLAIRFASVVVELRALLQDVPEFGTDMINRHPIVTLWVMKMADLSVLENTVYQPDSGLVQQLRKPLDKMSKVALGQLVTIINCKKMTETSVTLPIVSHCDHCKGEHAVEGCPHPAPPKPEDYDCITYWPAEPDAYSWYCDTPNEGVSIDWGWPGGQECSIADNHLDYHGRFIWYGPNGGYTPPPYNWDGTVREGEEKVFWEGTDRDGKSKGKKWVEGPYGKLHKYLEEHLKDLPAYAPVETIKTIFVEACLACGFRKVVIEERDGRYTSWADETPEDVYPEDLGFDTEDE